MNANLNEDAESSSRTSSSSEVGYGRHATHRLSPASRDSSRPGGLEKIRDIVFKSFFWNSFREISAPVPAILVSRPVSSSISQSLLQV